MTVKVTEPEETKEETKPQGEVETKEKEETKPAEKLTLTTDELDAKIKEAVKEATEKDKQESRKWEGFAKRDFDAANKWREHEKTLLTEAERIEKLERENEQLKFKETKNTLLAESGLAPEWWDGITGDSEESVKSQVEFFKTNLAKLGAPSAPKPNLNQGNTKKEEAEKQDTSKLSHADKVASIAAAFADFTTD